MDDAKRMVSLAKYESWGSYQDYVPLNIEGRYRRVQANRRPN